MTGYWFERLLPKSAVMIVLLSTLVWASLVSAFIFGFDAFSGSQGTQSALGSSLFFSSLTVYLIVSGALVIRRSARIVENMTLGCSEQEQSVIVKSMFETSRTRSLVVFAFCLLGGLLHNMLLQGEVLNVFSSITANSIALTGAMGVFLVWLIVPWVIFAFFSNATLIAQLGQHRLAIDLIDPSSMRELGQVALLPVLGLASSQVLYPLLWLGGNINLLAVVPGFTLTTVSVVFLFVRATWPVHRRIVETKQREVTELNRLIREQTAEMKINWPELNALVSHREYLQNCSDWPFGISTVFRGALYLLIPPMTWFAAAVVEIITGSVLGS